MAMQAQDNFNVQLESGADLLVVKGQVFPDGHEVVKLDAGRGVLFKRLDFGEEQPAAAPKSAAAGPAKTAPAKAGAPVRAAGTVTATAAAPPAPPKAGGPA